MQILLHNQLVDQTIYYGVDGSEGKLCGQKEWRQDLLDPWLAWLLPAAVGRGRRHRLQLKMAITTPHHGDLGFLEPHFLNKREKEYLGVAEM